MGEYGLSISKIVVDREKLFLIMYIAATNLKLVLFNAMCQINKGNNAKVI